MQDGAHWKSLRRFTLKALRDFGVGKSTLEEKIKYEVDFVLAEFDNKKGMPFDPKEIFDKAVSNIICSIIFGQRSVLFLSSSMQSTWHCINVMHASMHMCCT